MHNAAFEALGLNWVYLPFEVNPENLERAVKAIVPLNIQGINLTIPHKKDVIPFLDELSTEAEFIGAVNTIVRKGNKLIGYNTDGEGFIRALEEEKIPYIGKNVLVLGAGGAAYAICYQLASKGVNKLKIYNRTIKKARDLEKRLKEKPFSMQVESGDREIFIFESDLSKKGLKDIQILINATSFGMKADDYFLPFINESCINPSLEAVVDIIYNPPETKLLRIAKKKGIKTMNGLGMLLHQGALSFELWTGKKAPIDVMRKALYKQFKI
jgi:shikimate dehydrogenase